jgi:hypothetical protein
MPSNQVRPSAWTPLRTAALKKSLLVRVPNLRSKCKSLSFKHLLVARPIVAVHKTAIQRTNSFKRSITSLHVLLSNVRSKAARQTERTYIPRWPESWPAKLCTDYKIYKKYDEVYWTLWNKFANHYFRHRNVQLGTPESLERIQLCTSLAEAALR